MLYSGWTHQDRGCFQSEPPPPCRVGRGFPSREGPSTPRNQPAAALSHLASERVPAVPTGREGLGIRRPGPVRENWLWACGQTRHPPGPQGLTQLLGGPGTRGVPGCLEGSLCVHSNGAFRFPASGWTRVLLCGGTRRGQGQPAMSVPGPAAHLGLGQACAHPTSVSPVLWSCTQSKNSHTRV